jgi:putative glutathione S-transferase
MVSSNDNNNAQVFGPTGITTDDQTSAKERRANGEFVRGVSSARHWIDPNSQYPPAEDRYHLIVAYNCPWCHRVLIARALLGLEHVISVDVVFPNRSTDKEPLGPNLWKFCPQGQEGLNGRWTQFPECNSGMYSKTYVKEIYEMAGISDQKSVPILLDKESNTIVNNESAEIIRMMAVNMKEFHTRTWDLFPQDKAEEITKLNDFIYQKISNGSYKAGFSSNQEVYETAYRDYFDALKVLNERLANQKFLMGSTITEADVRLFPTLYRHDPIYYLRFKLRRICGNIHTCGDGWPIAWPWREWKPFQTRPTWPIANKDTLDELAMGLSQLGQWDIRSVTRFWIGKSQKANRMIVCNLRNSD